jgi:hypothetical protein
LMCNDRSVVAISVAISANFPHDSTTAPVQSMGDGSLGNAHTQGIADVVPFVFGDLPITHGYLLVVVNEKITRRWVTSKLVSHLTCGSPPHNNRFNPPQRGRHALCSVGLWVMSFGKGRAGTPIHLSFPGQVNGGHSFAG